MEISKRVIGLVATTEKFMETEMYSVSIDDYKEADRSVCSVMGFKLLWGLTRDGEIYEFMRSGNIRKKDLEAMKALGVEEAFTHGAFAPTNWLINGERWVRTKKSFVLGADTKNLLSEWARAFS